MCGFVGAVGLDAEVPEAVRRRVLSTIPHRGPDAEGQYVRLINSYGSSVS